jgi:hypothetical protein
MNYFKKYTKYKEKYILLKKQFVYGKKQIGGDKPNANILKEINLFNDELQPWLDPVWGFWWSETPIIENYLDVDILRTKPDNFFKFIKKNFHSVNGIYKPTNNLFSLTPEDIGQFLAYNYLVKDSEENKQIIMIDEKIDLIKEYITKMTDIREETMETNKQIIESLEKNDYQNITVSDIRLNRRLMPIDMLKDYSKLLESYKKKITISIIEKYPKPIYGSLLATKIIKEYFKLFSNKDFNYYRAVLTVCWWISNNKLGITNYYLGINKIFPEKLKVIIPEDFASTLYTNSILDEKIITNFYDGLYVLYKDKFTGIKIISYEKVNNEFGLQFPDCGESSLRNFINAIIYDNKTMNYKLENLDILGATEKLKEYYRIFNNEELQSSTQKIDIFEGSYNAREAWTIVVSDLPNVMYSKIYNDYKYEIDCGSVTDSEGKSVLNILMVLRVLFTNIKEFDDFEKLLPIIKISESGTTDETIITEFVIKINKLVYILTLYNNHYDFKEIKEGSERKEYEITVKDSEQQFYLDLFSNKIYQTIESNISYITKNNKWIYFINFSMRNIMMIFKFSKTISENIIDDEIYDAFFCKFYRYNDEYLTSRTVINQKRIRFSRYDFSTNGFIYGDAGNKNIENIVDIVEATNKILFEPSLLYLFTNLKKFFVGFEIDLCKCVFPKSIKSITLEHYSLKENNCLPNSITHLTFGELCNKPVGHQGCEDTKCPRNLPNSITHLTFGRNFNQPADKLPNAITHLIFGNNFNQPVDNLPNSITHLTFGYWFNQPVNNLPNSMTHLTFGYYFNQPVNNLPNSITHLTFEWKFNQPVDKLPNSITHLTFGYEFNQPINNLPISITHLIFGEYFNKPVDNLPNSITHLTFGTRFNQPVNNLPISITNLTFGWDFNKPVNNLPNSITHLTFGKYFNRLVDYLPNSITHLTFGSTFKQEIDYLPISITHLTLNNLNLYTENLPPCLTHLTIKTLPDNLELLAPRLTSLKLTSQIDNFDNFLSPTIKTLEVFGCGQINLLYVETLIIELISDYVLIESNSLKKIILKNPNLLNYIIGYPSDSVIVDEQGKKLK